MNKTKTIYVGLLLTIFYFSASATKWSLYLEQANEKRILVHSFSFKREQQVNVNKTIGNFHIKFETSFKNDYWTYHATARTLHGTEKCFMSLVCDYGTKDIPYNFDGKVSKSEIYRQSPHEPGDYFFISKLAMQAVPMIAIQSANQLEVAILDNPAMYENYTTQLFDIRMRQLRLSSGDNGLIYKNKSFQLNSDTVGRREKKLFRVEPYYAEIDTEKEQSFRGIYFRIKPDNNVEIREIANRFISKNWSNGKITDKLGTSFFSTAYMNLRVNETGSSRYWVIPAIDYSNKQYSRDAFWISMILPPDFSQSCFEHELAFDKEFIGAEKQLFTLIWAYRNYRQGFTIDTVRLAKLLKIVESRVYNGFYSGFSENARVVGSWQGWADLVAFHPHDAIASNQGLLVTALYCMQEMGMKTTISVELAHKNYQKMFNPKIGGYPVSFQKDTILAVDALKGDLLARLYLGKSLLPDKDVVTHYQTLNRHAKTKYGYKVFCNSDGSYLQPKQYNAGNFKSLLLDYNDGDYQRGGSWYLYDMLMLIDAYLAGAKEAEDDMIWRTKLEFELGKTTHEYIDTATGVPHKANMGWNAAIYVLWQEVMKKGKASNRFFETINN